MTVTEQFENLSRNVEELPSEEQAAAREEIVRRLSVITLNLRALTDHAMLIYQAASVLAPETAELAVEIWDHLYKDFAFVSTAFDRIKKAHPALADLVKEPSEIFRDLVEKSALAILQWDAQAEGYSQIPPKPQEIESLVLVPNDETAAAIKESRRNDLNSFNTVAELMADLNAED
jgi:hypothetical protein